MYSQVFQCPRCLEKVALFDCVEVAAETKDGKPKTIAACPHCYHGRGITEEISTRAAKYGSIPVLVSYLCQEGCKPAKGERRHNDPDERKREYFHRYDLGKLREIEAREILHWYPTMPMIAGRETRVKRNLPEQGVHAVADLFTKRNLWALAVYFQVAREHSDQTAADAFRFALNSILLAMSRMQGYTEDARFPNQLMRGTYYLPQVSREYNVAEWLTGKLNNLVAGYAKIDAEISSGDIIVSTQSATKLDSMPANSVDYIFTDPPYSGNQQYGELNFVWEAWQGFDTEWQDEEIIVNEVRGKSEADWANMMRLAMQECYRVLKPGRWLSLCFHDTSEGTWELVQDIMAEALFLADRTDSALFIETSQKSFNQLTADKVTKRDLVINFRKPRPGEAVAETLITGDEDTTTFSDKVRAIIREYLVSHPGSSKDRVYDEVVSRMVRAGRMEAHNFEGLLRQVAEPAVDNPSRWFLKETEEAALDATESAREDAAADGLRAFISGYLAEHRGVEGVHYSDLFEHYVYSVQEKPRRPLAEWLPDYFYKTPDGTYRLSANEEEEQAKAEGRTQGTNRRIKRYTSYLQQGVAAPHREQPNSATLAEWIRHCKRSGLYEQGKLLYERGGLDLDSLPEEMMVAVEEDYSVCARMLARAAAAEGDKPKRGRKGASTQAGMEFDS